MPHFCVTLAGKGIHIPSADGDAPIVGFYSVARLRAGSAQQASELALANCRQRLGETLARSGGTAHGLTLEIEDLHRCSWLKALIWPGGGFIFFRADDDDT